MYLPEEIGQEPWLSSREDTFPENELDRIFNQTLKDMPESTQNRTLEKAWTLSEYYQHILSIPDASEIKYPLAEQYTETCSPKILYDKYGITRKFCFKGKEALRTILPFNALNSADSEGDQSEGDSPEPQTPPSMVAMGLSQESEAFEVNSSSAEEWDLDSEVEREREVEFYEGPDTGSQSPCSGSESHQSSSSSSTYEPSDDCSDTRSLHASSREPSPSVEIQDRWLEVASKLVSPNEPLPSRPSLQIQWPHDDQSMHGVVFDLQEYWPLEAEELTPLQGKPPSPLPSLTPSPPPKRKATLGKRAKPEVEETPHKRTRRARTVAYDNEAGPSTAPYNSPSPPSDGGSEYASPPPPPSRRKASKTRSRNKSATKASTISRRHKCIIKGCTQHGFTIPKDRNRHMDIHFDPRFRCIGCSKMFPRDDALKRHAEKSSPSKKCNQLYVSGENYAICPPYWLRCDLDLLECPPKFDPLFSFYVGRVRKEVGQAAAKALLEGN
ncbi:hypothetical protein BDY19DRAFT_907278 [Irpex rosettiformis]|uniref:Uncharacterized protein n=1 Tax=Irpex rosettiformis TaxID=378272 RepID=A0ACB8U199_9APHY|nr:hypothetical protein BDY19DRAFT_907278 [Irpex rosettiformis]